ncbi:CBASS cGAMP-activated phospholipase [Chitinophaga agri]|uniref:Patatin-like phospholipase family protein n=1 Tax=Chitinophaga agri TaxID=2703787 RepID=A0A6B9ZNE5_9BACT|nr:CBASS cGAMP-activated phospholipase [Chitinophaga agri]QHS63526.1 patatin-like phospholipase family protein [Chitinophaga agri]
MQADQPFKILAIDGGGIKGLYSASILARIEQKTGKKIGDHFDMICGTSTGGLIALALSTGKPAQEIADMYFNRGREIFTVSEIRPIRWLQRRWQFMCQLLGYGKFSADPLKQILSDMFEEKTMGQANNLLCIPSYNLIRGMPRVFKYPHAEGGFFMDRDIKMVDVALATSAAPTYLPIHEHNNILYADGGLWANNPALCGLLEALDFFVGPDKQFSSFKILSVSSVAQPSGWASTSKRHRSFRHWGNKLFQASMDGQAYFNDFFLKRIINNIQPSGTYYRIPPPALSKQHIGLIDMDIAHQKALKTLKAMGDQDGYHYAIQNEVLEFFDHPKIYQTNPKP